MRALWTCYKIQARLWEDVTGNSIDVEDARLRIHLERCGACRKAVDRARVAIPLIHALRSHPIPGSDADFGDVVRRIQNRRHDSAPLRYSLASVFIIAAASAICTMTVKYAWAPDTRQWRGESFNMQDTRVAELRSHQIIQRDHIAAARRNDRMVQQPPRGNALLSRQRTTIPGTLVAARPFPRLKQRYYTPIVRPRGGVRDPIENSNTLALRTAARSPVARVDGGGPAGDAAGVSLSDQSVVQADNTGGDHFVPLSPNRAFVMPSVTMGQVHGAPCSFVMGSIPVSMGAGHAGSAGAEAHYLEAGKAL